VQQREGNDIRYVAPEVVYAYDKAGRQVGERDARGNWTTRVVDALGRKTQEFDTVEPGSTTGQTSRLYAYDGFGRMTRVNRPTLSSGTRPSETYDYDSLGQRIRHADMAGRIERTDYDALRRVSS
jgi:YD repeat-containing protein